MKCSYVTSVSIGRNELVISIWQWYLHHIHMAEISPPHTTHTYIHGCCEFKTELYILYIYIYIYIVCVCVFAEIGLFHSIYIYIYIYVFVEIGCSCWQIQKHDNTCLEQWSLWKIALVRYWRAKISAALQKENSRLIISEANWVRCRSHQGAAHLGLDHFSNIWRLTWSPSFCYRYIHLVVMQKKTGENNSNDSVA